MDYETALKGLAFPDTWCEAARFLAVLGDTEALMPLVAAYEQDVESSRRCLLDAMEALDPVTGAHNLFDWASGETRRMAIHLMELFASDTHLSRLTLAVSDVDVDVRAQARSALAGQLQTPVWEVTMISLLAHVDPKMRAQAVKSLSRRRTEVVRQALAQRLGVEPDHALKSALESALGSM